MGYCKTAIKAGIEPNCGAQPKGFVTTGYIFNYDEIDWDKVVVNTEVEPNGSVIKTMPLKTGAKGYKIGQTKDAFNETQTVLETGGAYANTFSSDVHFAILDSSVEATNVMNALANGEFVILLEQKANNASDNGASKFRLYGFENGLRATEATNTPNGDTGNVWSTVLQEVEATKSAYYLFNTSVETTRTAVEAYVAD